MFRVTIAIATTLSFTGLGLVIGHLTMRAYRASTPSGVFRAGTDDLLRCYVLAPVLGGVLGLAVFALCMRLFGPRSPAR